MSIHGSVPSGAVTITPSDSVNNLNLLGLYVGTTGSVKVTTAGGDTVTFVGVPAGKDILLNVTRVWSTGTTASNILGYKT
jgi:hypothetical protein